MKKNLDKVIRSLLEPEANRRSSGKNKSIWNLAFEICGRHKSDYDAEKPFNSKNDVKTSKEFKK